MNYQLINKNRGFTLLETLVAVFILTMALNSLFTLVANSLFSSMYAKNEITSTYLAQEAVDYIRNDRDSIAYQGSNGGDWNSFLARYGYIDSSLTSCFKPNGCTIDASNFSDTSIKGCFGSCSTFLYDSGASEGSYYTYDSTITGVIPTTFNRKINLSFNANNPDELYIDVTINWANGGMPRSKVLSASLLKWQ